MYGINEMISALRRYKEQQGRYWKSNLKKHWLNDNVLQPNLNRDKPVLRQIRNICPDLIDCI